MGIVWVWIVLLVAMLLLLALIKRVFEPRTSKDDAASTEPLPFQRAYHLLSPAEREFHMALRQAIGEQSGLVIFAKVRLWDLLYLPGGTANRQGHQNRVDRKHVDFVLCDEESRPVLVIELDDSSHEREDRRERDSFVDRVLKAAGLPILHVRCRRSYDARVLAQQIGSLIEESALRKVWVKQR